MERRRPRPGDTRGGRPGPVPEGTGELRSREKATPPEPAETMRTTAMATESNGCLEGPDVTALYRAEPRRQRRAHNAARLAAVRERLVPRR